MNNSNVFKQTTFMYSFKCADLTVKLCLFPSVKYFHVFSQTYPLNRFVAFSTNHIFTLLMNIFNME